MDVLDLIEEFNQQMRQAVLQMESGSGDKFGLDIRAGYHIYVNENCIIVQRGHADKTLRYYGGFEYVEEECRQEVGDYVIYLQDSDRVQEAIDCYYQQIEQAEQVD